MPIANFDLAGDFYYEFLHKYSDPHDYNGKNYKHHIPSSFVYRLIKGNCVWLLTLIMGVAGYNMYFDDDSEASQVLTLEKLNAAGVTDPVLKYNSKITPWEGRISGGKRATDPVSRWSTGLGICHYQGQKFKDIYKGVVVTSRLPLIDSNGKIIEENGKRKSAVFTVYYKGKQVRGWGVGYGGKALDKSTIATQTNYIDYENSGNKVILKVKGDISSRVWKFIGGPSEWGKDYHLNGKSSGEVVGKYMSESEANQFKDWAKYHFSIPEDALYPAIKWMADYWAPYFSWEGGNTLNLCIYLAGYANSGFTNITRFNGQSVEALKEAWPKQGRSHPEHRTANLERVEALMTFVKQRISG